MKKTQNNLLLLYMVFAIGLITANAIGAKIFTTGIDLFGAPITLTCGALAYPVSACGGRSAAGCIRSTAGTELHVCVRIFGFVHGQPDL